MTLSTFADPSPVFQPGDRWAAIGDSITHGRRYHSFIYLFHATRYPENEFRTANCGISGDSAAGAVARFDWDIAPHKPTVATIMLGMNDVSRTLYGASQTGEAVETRRKDALTAHFTAMAQLAQRLKAMNCRLVFITPSIYDQTGKQATENLFGVNDALGLCGQGAKKLAAQVGGLALELHDPMTALNAKIQKEDPNLTLVGPDRVHPGDPGQLVMAYYLLKAMGVSGTVGEMVFENGGPGGMKPAAGLNSAVTELNSASGRLAFTYLAKSLPYPVLPAAADALKWVPFMEDLNRETLKVPGLATGKYAIKIDGDVVAVVTEKDLAAGVNLAGNPKSPMLKQALKVMELEEKRQSTAARMRTFAAQRHFVGRANPQLNIDDFEAVKAFLLADLEKKKNLGNYGYFKGQVDIYINDKPREAELQKIVDDAAAAIWKSNKPVAHKFEIALATATEIAAQAEGASPQAGEVKAPTATAGAPSKVIEEGDLTTPWQKVAWSDCEPTLRAEAGVLTVTAPRNPGKRDMLGLSKTVNIDLSGAKAIKLRYKADAKAPFGIEVVVDGKLTRLRSYEKATGDWEDLALPVTGSKLTSVSLLLAEGSKDDVWQAPKVTYQFDRIWVE